LNESQIVGDGGFLNLQEVSKFRHAFEISY